MTDDVELQSSIDPKRPRIVLRLFAAPEKKTIIVSEVFPEQQALNALYEKHRALLLERTTTDRMFRSDKKNNLLDALKKQEDEITTDIQRIREIKDLKEFSLTKKPSNDRHIARNTATQCSSEILRKNPALKAVIHCALELIRLESHLFTFGHKAKRRAGFAILAALHTLQNPRTDIKNELAQVKYLGRRRTVTLFSENNGVAKLLRDFQSGKHRLNEPPLKKTEEASKFLNGEESVLCSPSILARVLTG